MFSIGEGYELYMGRWSRLLVPSHVAFAGVEDGDRILDVGTGTGAVALTLEAALPRSQIVGVDPSAAFVAYATTSARSSRATFEVGDAQALRFKEASFDHAMALLVMNFIPDHGKAVSEMKRVTRPGGIVSACVWDYGDGMVGLRLFWDEVVTLDPDASPKHERNMKLSRRGELGALWKHGGLGDVREAPVVIDQAFSSFDDYWTPFLKGTGPGGAYVAALSDERRKDLEARLRRRLLGDRADGSFTLKARAWCVRGQVP
ncbi:MAG TPA: class I SAM-dependent methyltransferase [Polyangia bacterium]|jgi:SAM-dependent methyltransferase|nr:class I SAM-dependent methyltransferase [Polyangia bacterium]